MQTLLDTNIQLNLYTRHAQGLPVHYGFLTIKQPAACLGSEKGVTGGGVGEMSLSCMHSSYNNSANIAHDACSCIYYVMSCI